MTQLSVGLALDLGKNTLVLAFNSPVSVPTPSDYEVRIAPALINAGVRQLANGKVKFPGKSMVAGLVLVDDDFQMVRVTVPTKAGVVASLNMEQPADQSAWAKLEKFLKAIPDDSLTAGLAQRFLEVDSAPLRAFWADLKAQMSGVDLVAVASELAQLAEQYEASLPSSAISED